MHVNLMKTVSTYFEAAKDIFLMGQTFLVECACLGGAVSFRNTAQSCPPSRNCWTWWNYIPVLSRMHTTVVTSKDDLRMTETREHSENVFLRHSTRFRWHDGVHIGAHQRRRYDKYTCNVFVYFSLSDFSFHLSFISSFTYNLISRAAGR